MGLEVEHRVERRVLGSNRSFLFAVCFGFDRAWFCVAFFTEAVGEFGFVGMG